MTNKLISLLFGLLISSQARAEMMRPQIAVKAEILTARIDGQFKVPTERQRLLDEIETLVIAEAKKRFPCMQWQAESSSIDSATRAELLVRLIDSEDDYKPEVKVSYAATYDPHGKKTIKPLPAKFDRVVLAVNEHPGNLRLFKNNLSVAIKRQFGDEGFEKEFNSNFIGNVMIAEEIGFDDKSSDILVPVAAGDMSLEAASLLVYLVQAPTCNGRQSCTMTVTSYPGVYSGGYKGGAWRGALRCSFKNDDCCGAPWPEIRTVAAGASERVVFLKEHRHCSVCLGSKGIYSSPGAP